MGGKLRSSQAGNGNTGVEAAEPRKGKRKGVLEGSEVFDASGMLEEHVPSKKQTKKLAKQLCDDTRERIVRMAEEKIFTGMKHARGLTSRI